MSMLKTAANGMAWTSLSTIVRSAVSLLQVAVLTRYLEKSDFGVVAIATLFIGFIQIFMDMGLSVGIMHKRDTTKKEYSSLFWLNIFSGLVLTFLIAAAAPVVADYYDEPSLTRILTLLSLSVFLSALGSQQRTVQQKKMRFKSISIIEILSSVATIISAILLAVNGYGIYSLVFPTLLNVFVSNSLFLIIGIYKDRNISFHFSLRETYPYLKIGVFSLGTQILDYLSRELDVFIISTSLGKEVLGVYSLCKRLILALYNAVNPILMKVLTPMLAEMQDDRIRLRSVYFRIVESIAIINYPIYCLIAVFSYAILSLVYGSAYADSSIILGLLALLYAYLTVGSPIGALQTAVGRTDTGFYWTICRIILYCITVYVGSLVSLEAIIVGLISTNLLVSPLAWRITVKPLIGGRFWAFFKIGFIPYVLTISYSLPFFVFFSMQRNVFICAFIGIVYLLIYLLFLFKRRDSIFIAGILYNKIMRLSPRE